MAQYRIKCLPQYKMLYHLEKKALFWWSYLMTLDKQECEIMKTRIMSRGTHRKPENDQVIWQYDTKIPTIDHGEY